jgi:hypothetical protein
VERIVDVEKGSIVGFDPFDPISDSGFERPIWMLCSPRRAGAVFDDCRQPRRGDFARRGGRGIGISAVRSAQRLLGIFETRRPALARIEVKVADGGVQVTAGGEPFDPARHRSEHEVKVITYHELKVEQQADGTWLAEVIVDI